MMRMMIVGLLCASLAGAAHAGGACGGKDAKADKSYNAACGAEQNVSKVKIKSIDTATLAEKMGNGAQLTLIDARTAKWDDGKRLPGAISVSAESTDEQILAALPDKSAKIVTYCSNEKCPASETLASRLVQLGYTYVMKYPQGLDGWSEAGHEVVDTRAAQPGQS